MKQDMMIGLAFGSLLALAACDSTPPEQTGTPNDRAADPNEAPAATKPFEAQGDPMATNTPTQDAAADKAAGETDKSSEGAVVASFPTNFQGRWAVRAVDCGGAKGLETTVMAIEPAGMKFYESSAVLLSATQDGDAITARMRWTGEGETRDGTTVFTLKDNGQTLTRAEPGPAGALIYKKCAA